MLFMYAAIDAREKEEEEEEERPEDHTPKCAKKKRLGPKTKHNTRPLSDETRMKDRHTEPRGSSSGKIERRRPPNHITKKTRNAGQPQTIAPLHHTLSHK